LITTTGEYLASFDSCCSLSKVITKPMIGPCFSIANKLYLEHEG
jgi:hypothetical protein